MTTLSRSIGHLFEGWIDSAVGLFVRLRVTPNTLTVIGLFLNVGVAVLFASGLLRIGAVLLFWAGAFDTLDGALARKSGLVTRFGSFFDSVIDRCSDAVVFAGILFYFHYAGSTLYVLLTLFAMIAAMLTSYTRARAESIIPTCAVGFMERPERTVVLILGGLIGHLENALWVLAFFSTLAVVHRVAFLWRWVEPPSGMMEEEMEELRGLREEEISRRFFPRWFNIVFCNFPRASLGWDVVCAFIIVFLLLPIF